MNVATLARWTMLVNTRIGSPVTDASGAEIKRAMARYASDNGAAYVKKFLKSGNAWRAWLDSEDVVGLTGYVVSARAAR